MQGQGDEQLVIYANPNQGTFRIKVPDAFLHRSGLQLKVIDSAGRIVHDQTLNLQGESPRMDLFDVSPGYYLVTLGNSERTYSGHMVVE
ncbi:MAG: T9SS type A sorting domain-containing protein [Flavobacteriales bacterium]|nr:T9SS type A sorting domain-containing protein [Flavobacteriales bacterium]